jgi:metal-responsive CopG/Arc/MetJ family transcriptional regulator
MSTLEVTLDPDLLARVDQATQALGISRESFIQQALEQSLRQLAIVELEQKHRAGYERHPVKPDEFESWEAEQAWGEA